MIKKNENISIIYGGHGREYAKKLKEVLEEAKKKEKYNFNANIVMDNILCCDVLDRVIQLVKDTRLAVIFLTKDDVVNTENGTMYRPRQNVILEIGMLLSVIGIENCIFLSDFSMQEAKDFEMPSDLVKIMPTYFNNENINEIFNQVLSKIISNLKLVSYSNLLYNDKYPFNYSKLFNEKDNAFLLTFNEKEQKDRILDLWLAELASLDEIDQMLVFILERLPMINLFRYTLKLSDFYTNSMQIIRDKLNEQYSELNYAIFEIINCIIGYSSTKAGFRLGKIEPLEARNNFLDYYLRLDTYINNIIVCNQINNVVSINAYDYLALLALIQYNMNGNVDYLNQAIDCFNKCERLAMQFDDGTSLWKGYIQYNLARAYDRLGEITTGEEVENNRDLAVRYANNAVNSRKGWISESKFPSSITNSFLYEFFLARMFKYEMHQKKKDDYSEEMLRQELSEIKKDFDVYFLNDKTSNSLLLEIKEKLDKLD